MKELKLTVQIGKPIEEVFEFTTNPSNTPLWIDGIVKEVAEPKPVKLGTVYRNWDKAGKLSEYEVKQYDPPKVFQLDATQQDYKVRYTYRSLSDYETELEYYEWSEAGELHSPFMQEILDKLKQIMESP